MSRIAIKITVLAMVTAFAMIPLAVSHAALLSSMLPPTQVQDNVVHDKGNIRVTVTNWGEIGGYSFYQPSGEWPKNSGREYLAEIKYWMGAVTEDGDTVVINSEEDLMPIPSLVSDRETYGIRMSTIDTTYDYYVSDTVGLGCGRPSYGWRVYDPETSQWRYNSIWDPIKEEFFDGGPIAQQESHFRMNDTAHVSSLLGIEITHTVYQWNFSYNENYLFFVLQITNASEQDYSDFAFGLYCDFDIGGDDGQGENGRLGDLVAFDEERNLAWTYDEDAYDPGWGRDVETGVMGTKYIETPDGIGMTSFRTDEWVNRYTDQERFELINSDQFDESLPPNDQYYIQCTRGIDLQAGKTVRVVYALIAGQDSTQLKSNADVAQMIYDNYFVGPEPPSQPKLHVKAGDNKAKLWWDNSSEYSIDPSTGELDFAGYRIYKSTDFGLTWGKKIRNEDGSIGPGYVPIAKYEKLDVDDMVPHTFIDSTATNGFDYWYSIVAYDEGDQNISSLACAIGTPGSDSNAVETRPRSLPAGYYPVEKTMSHTAENQGRLSDGRIVVTEYDASQMTDNQYEVRFSDDDYATYWHLLNVSTGDTLLANQFVQTEDDDKSTTVTDGFSLIVIDAEIDPTATSQTEFSVAGDTTLRTTGNTANSMVFAAGLPQTGSIHYRADYELRFTASGSEGYWWYDDVTPYALPFEIWNVTTGEQVIAEIWDFKFDGEWTPWDPEDGTKDLIFIVNHPYDGSPHPEAYPYSHIWAFTLDTIGIDRWGPGDVLTIHGAPLNGPDDVFSFRGAGIDFAAAKSGLDNIKVVPNPYMVNAAWESIKGDRRLEFVNLPDVCTVRIYTLAGDLVQTIEHSGNDGTAYWDVMSSNAQGVAPGIYFYAVESEYGSKIGKFAVIK
jgi:hypothetical protein